MWLRVLLLAPPVAEALPGPTMTDATIAATSTRPIENLRIMGSFRDFTHSYARPGM
jgi:hypothetical protein